MAQRRHLLAFAFAALFALLAPASALAQGCNKTSIANFLGPSGPTEFVPAINNARVYLCGYVLSAYQQSLDFQIVTGTGVNCADNQTPVTPVIELPNGGVMVNRMPYVTGEITPIGNALCWKVSGGSSAALAVTVYWAQF
jgi:hypothetical protein